jgi:hypothetical protein
MKLCAGVRTQLNATRAEEMPMRKVPLASASELPTSQVLQQGLDLLLLAVDCVYDKFF